MTIDQKGKATKLWRNAFISASLFGACLEIMDFPTFVIPHVAARVINEHVVMDNSPSLTPTMYASEDRAKVDTAGTTRIADGTTHVGRRRRLDSKYSDAWHGIDEITWCGLDGKGGDAFRGRPNVPFCFVALNLGDWLCWPFCRGTGNLYIEGRCWAAPFGSSVSFTRSGGKFMMRLTWTWSDVATFRHRILLLSPSSSPVPNRTKFDAVPPLKGPPGPVWFLLRLLNRGSQGNDAAVLLYGKFPLLQSPPHHSHHTLDLRFSTVEARHDEARSGSGDEGFMLCYA